MNNKKKVVWNYMDSWSCDSRSSWHFRGLKNYEKGQERRKKIEG
jgi:hypothetical protein